MTKDEFQLQIDRLRSTWPSSYPEEKVTLIWRTVRDMPEFWFENLVSKLIAHSRAAPLPVDFIEAFEVHRKKNRNFSSSIDAGPKNVSIFSDEERKQLFEICRKAASGAISKQESKKHADLVAEALRSNGIEPEPYDFH